MFHHYIEKFKKRFLKSKALFRHVSYSTSVDISKWCRQVYVTAVCLAKYFRHLEKITLHHPLNYHKKSITFTKDTFFFYFTRISWLIRHNIDRNFFPWLIGMLTWKFWYVHMRTDKSIFVRVQTFSALQWVVNDSSKLWIVSQFFYVWLICLWLMPIVSSTTFFAYILNSRFIIRVVTYKNLRKQIRQTLQSGFFFSNNFLLYPI